MSLRGANKDFGFTFNMGVKNKLPSVKTGNVQSIFPG